MAIVKCKECGNQVSGKAKACPHCGVADPDPSAAGSRLIRNVFAAVVIVLGLYSCAKVMNNSGSSPPAASDGHTEALTLCRMAIRRTAKNPSSAKVPYAKDVGVAGAHRFIWRRGDGLTMMNGFGANIDTAAVCSTNAAGTQILGLTVDGNDIF